MTNANVEKNNKKKKKLRKTNHTLRLTSQKNEISIWEQKSFFTKTILTYRHGHRHGQGQRAVAIVSKLAYRRACSYVLIYVLRITFPVQLSSCDIKVT